MSKSSISSSVAAQLPRPSATQTLLSATLVSGVLDATAGVIVYFLLKGLNPIQVLQYIASGAFGSSAFEGGLLMALVGMLFHFSIAFAFSLGFFLVYPLVQKLTNWNVYITGLLYGLFIWLLMNLLVLPNSAIPQAPFSPLSAGLEIAWHMALVGLPIVFLIKKHFDAKDLF